MLTREEVRSRRLTWIRRLVIFMTAMGVVLYLASGAMKSYLSSPPLKKHFNEQLAKSLPGWTVDFSSAGIGLSGTLPRLALVVEGLVLKGSHRCLNYDMSSSDTRVHLSWGSLLQGIVQIAQVTAEEVAVDLRDIVDCGRVILPPQTESSPQNDPPQPVEPEEPAAESAVGDELPVEKEPNREVNQVPAEAPSKAGRVALLSEIRVGRAEVSYRKQKLVFTDLQTNAYFPDQPLKIRGGIRYELVGAPKQRYPKVQFQAALLGDEVNWSSRGSWREGNMSFQGRIRGSQVEVEGKMAHIPLAPAVDLLVHYDLWKKPMNYQSAWLSCGGQLSGDLAKREVRAELRECGIEGEIGRAKLGALNLEVNGAQKVTLLDTAHLHLSKVHVDKVLDVLDIDVLGGVLADFGHVDALMRIEPSGEAELEGEIADLSFAFSNQNVAARQRVSSLKGKVFYDGQRVSGQIIDMKLFKGEFDGMLSFNFDRHLREGAMQVGIQRILFDPTIQRLLAGKSMSSIAFFGKAKVANNRLERWDGTLGLDQLASEKIEMKKVKLDYLFEKDELKLALSADQGAIDPDSTIFRLLQPTFLVRSFVSDTQKWNDLRATFLVRDKKTVVWESSTVNLAPNIRISSVGVMQPDQKVEGQVRVKLSSSQEISWDLSGTSDKPVLSPNTESLKELSRQREKSQQGT